MSPRLANAFLAKMANPYPEENRKVRFLDPMCGSGTTALTAYALGFSVDASDLMYPAFTITSAKLHRLSQESIRSMGEVSDAIGLASRKNAYAKWLNWSLWYTPKVLSSLEQICEQIDDVRNKAFFPHLLTAFFQAAWDMSSADRNVIVPTRSQFNRKPPRLVGVSFEWKSGRTSNECFPPE